MSRVVREDVSSDHTGDGSVDYFGHITRVVDLIDPYVEIVALFQDFEVSTLPKEIVTYFRET